MLSSATFAASFAINLALTTALPQHYPLLRRDIGSNLGPQLSSKAAIYTQSDGEFADQSARWTTWNAPTFSAVVEPATEDDIIATIKYANAQNVTFFAQGAGHGYSGTLKVVQNAIMIKLATNFDYANYNSADKTVTIGGGTVFSRLINATYAGGRELTVGSGPCVGAIGAALAGGHGRLQGKWGLTQDAIESLRVVLASGTALDVTAKQNTDLWYAMRGAGQNFGIVVSAVLDTYPQTKNGMHYNGDMIMNGTQVEKVFELFNTMIPDWPAELAVDVLFAAIPGTLTPIISLSIIYAGPKEDAQRYASKFSALGGVINFAEDMFTWADLPFKAAGGGIAAACVKNQYRSTYSNNVKSFDIPSQRAAFTNYTNFITENPDASGSGLLWEVFGVQNVERPRNSAYANRQHATALGLLQFQYTDASLVPAMEAYGKAWREASIANSGYGDDKMYVYTNYARGDEPLEALFGYDSWRLKKLRELKSAYDPNNAFKGYHDVWQGNVECM